MTPPMSEPPSSERVAYRVEQDADGCACCGDGKSWVIVGPDEVALGTSYFHREDADDLAEDLNSAYEAGRRSVTNPHAAPVVMTEGGEVQESGCMSELAGDVVRLVLAARLVVYGGQATNPSAIKELDTACEAFASRVSWDDEPDDDEAPKDEGLPVSHTLPSGTYADWSGATSGPTPGVKVRVVDDYADGYREGLFMAARMLWEGSDGYAREAEESRKVVGKHGAEFAAALLRSWGNGLEIKANEPIPLPVAREVEAEGEKAS
jgi:hypothetical protein